MRQVEGRQSLEKINEWQHLTRKNSWGRLCISSLKVNAVSAQASAQRPNLSLPLPILGSTERIWKSSEVSSCPPPTQQCTSNCLNLKSVLSEGSQAWLSDWMSCVWERFRTLFSITFKCSVFWESPLCNKSPCEALMLGVNGRQTELLEGTKWRARLCSHDIAITSTLTSCVPWKSHLAYYCNSLESSTCMAWFICMHVCCASEKKIQNYNIW